MKKLIYLSILICGVSFAEGPNFQQSDTYNQQEFDNVYRDLRSKQKSGNYAVLAATESFSAPQTFLSGGSTVMTMTTAGEILQPLQPSFLALNASLRSDVTGDGTVYTIPYNTEIFDQGSDYDNATFTFTAPVTGRYFLSATALLAGITTSHTIKQLRIVTSNRTYTHYLDDGVAHNYREFVLATMVDMDANDTATVTATVSGSGKTVDVEVTEYTTFSGSLIN